MYEAEKQKDKNIYINNSNDIFKIIKMDQL